LPHPSRIGFSASNSLRRNVMAWIPLAGIFYEAPSESIDVKKS